MELASPQAVFELYRLLSNDNKCAFPRLLGQSSTAEGARLHMSNLSHTQQARFAEMMLPVIRDDIYPVVLQAACRIARSQPNLTSTELADAVDQAVKEKLEEHDRFISEREAARLKEQRDPKHGAATVQPIGFPVTQPKGLPDPSRPRPARLQLVGRWHEQMAS